MQVPDLPRNEEERLTLLRSLALLDTPQDERFERITRAAQRWFGVPIAALSIVDQARQWFKTQQGLDCSETPRDISFCGHTILQDEILEVPDAREDPRFADNPLVTGTPHIRFYAGCPVRVMGHKVGTLCLISPMPRKLDATERQLLTAMAEWAESLLTFHAKRYSPGFWLAQGQLPNWLSVVEQACLRTQSPVQITHLSFQPAPTDHWVPMTEMPTDQSTRKLIDMALGVVYPQIDAAVALGPTEGILVAAMHEATPLDKCRWQQTLKELAQEYPLLAWPSCQVTDHTWRPGIESEPALVRSLRQTPGSQAPVPRTGT